MLTWYTCDVKSARTSPKANDELSIWREEKRGSDDLGHAAAARGKPHDCLGVTLDHSKKKEASAEMTECVDQMKENSPEKLER